jgi:HptB-dependent secretion and biofilm anti anti-sigma factor
MDINILEADGATTIALKGRFDFQAHQRFRTAIDGLLKNGKARLRVDLAEVNFIDSSALGMLLLARENCEKAGGSVVLDRPQEYVNKVLKLCHFDQLFQVQG